MRQFLFTGFNGFGQFVGVDSGGSGNNKETTYKVMCEPDMWDVTGNCVDGTAGKLLIAPSWRYTAYALGSQLWLRGLLSKVPNEVVKAQTPGCIKALASCDKYCLVLLENGSLYKVAPQLDATLQEIKLETPTQIPLLPQKRSLFGKVRTIDNKVVISHIACGSNIVAAVSEDAVIYSIPSELHRLPQHTRVKQLECGFEHSLLLTTNGDVYTWGNGLRGQLGQVILRLEETPTLLEALAGVKITHIAAGGWHSAAISAFGDLYTWGFNVNGQLGMRVYKTDAKVSLKEPTVYPLPQLIDGPTCCADDACCALEVFAGSRHTLLKRSCGHLWAVGWCAHGQLGLGEKGLDFCDSFKRLNVPNVLDIISGPWCTVLIK